MPICVPVTFTVTTDTACQALVREEMIYGRDASREIDVPAADGVVARPAALLWWL